MVRLAFAKHLWTPGKVDKDDKNAAFNCTFLLGDANDENVKAVKRAMHAAGKAKFGAKWEDPNFRRRMAANGRFCLRDQGAKDHYDGFEQGKFFISARSKLRPEIRDRDGHTPLVETDGRPYSGCYVDGIVGIWAQQSNQYGDRINAQLVGVQFRQDGDAFGGGVRATDDDFADYTGGETVTEGAEEFEEVDPLG